MKRFIVAIVAIFATLVINAIPAKRTTFIATQSNGTRLTLMLVGDEYHHYFLNIDTQEKMLRGADGDYYVVADEILAERSKSGAARRVQANAARRAKLKAPAKIGSTSDSMTGNKKGLVILVNFQDKKLASTHTQTVFNNQFNQVGYSDGGHIGSVHDYFYDQSYKQFNLTFDVVGPVTVSKNMAYYGANDAEDSDTHPAEMIIEACKLADAQGVNYKDYDWDGDGYVDQVYVIYAGYGEAYGASDDTIWPHEWTLSSAKYYGDGTGRLYLDGKYIDTYACSCELSGTTGTTLNGIGTACHEFSHCLGFPDFYDTSYAGGFGMNSWDLMDGGSYNGPNGNGEVPAGYTAYERYEAGWLEPEILDEAATITDMKPIGDEPEAYFIFNEAETNEWFVLENRQNKGWFKYVDTYTTPHGLLITHVDFDQTVWNNNEPNKNATHQRMSIVPANKTYGTKKTSNGETYYTCSETQLKGHLFPGSSNVRSFIPNDWSTAGGKWFNKDTNGTYYSSHYLSEITESNGNISFNVDGGAVVDDGNRYTITYNAGTGTCPESTWTQSSYQETTTLPRAYAPSSDWTFVGWSTASVEETSKFPSTLIYYANSTILPTENMTLYAVYKQTVSGGTGTGSGSGDYELVTTEPSDWSGDYLIVYSNNNTDAFILDGSLTTLDVAKNYQQKTITNNTLSASECSAYNFTIAQASTKGSYTIKSANNIYIGHSGTKNTLNTSETATTYTNSISLNSNGSVKIGAGTYSLRFNNATDQMRFRYFTSGQQDIFLFRKGGSSSGGGSTTIYNTNPGTAVLPTPTISFPSSTKTILLGDSEIYTATVTGSTGEVTYSSSDETVATVGPSTGRISTKSTGTTVITATVAAVAGVSKQATAKYTLTVNMPELVSIAVTTQPTKTIYSEGESFSKDGMVVTATYKNGYKEPVDFYTCTPSTSVALTTSDKSITISYEEGGITATTTLPITVNALARYTVSFNAGSGTCGTTTLTEESYQAGVALPEATGVNDEWKFAGWATALVATETTTKPTLYAAGTTYNPTSDITLFAVYSRSETSGGSGNYELVESELTDWSGDYIIAYSNSIMADGSVGGQTGIGALGKKATPGSNLSGKTISTEWGDQYHVTLEAIDGGYVLKTQDGKYNYQTSNANGIAITDNIETASKYPITVGFVSSARIDLSVSGTAFHYNINNNSTDGGWFRFYKNGGQSPVYLYKKQGSLKNVTYSSNPSGGALIEPTISFASTANRNMLVGDKYTNKATAKNSTGAISYSSSDTNVATVNSETGEITATGVGTATITAFVDAVVGVSKSASTTFQVIVTMPELTGISIATPATTTTFNEGDSFTAEGLSITATYRNGYSQTLTEGFTTTPAEGDAVAFGTTAVEVSLTEGSVTKTATYSITVSELPKYEVTFVINGKSTTIKETIANNGVVAPDVKDINGYTFSGWSLTDVTEETTTKPKTVTLTDGKYMPTEATTLYAVYVKSEGKVVDGFTLSLTYKDVTYYAGAYNSTNARLDSKTTETDAVTLYFDEGYLWYVSGGKVNYLYNVSGKADLKSTTEKKTASATWTMTEEEDGSVTFYSSTTTRYLALNSGSTGIIRCYGNTYPHNWNLTTTGETYSAGATDYYTGHPGTEEEVKSIGGLAKTIKVALEEGTITLKEIEEYRDALLEK